MIFHDRSIATSSFSASGPTGMPAKRAQFSIIAAGTPSFSMRWPSLMKVPNTRRGEEAAAVVDDDRRLADLLHEVHGAASVSGEVFLPTMISTSGIFSTGEKKCRPMK